MDPRQCKCSQIQKLTLTAVNVRVLKLLGKCVNNIFPPLAGQTSSVDGSSLKALGKLPISISMGDITIKDIVHVFPSIQGEMLISWMTAQHLRIFSKNYSQQVHAMTNAHVQPQHEVTVDDLIGNF